MRYLRLFPDILFLLCTWLNPVKKNVVLFLFNETSTALGNTGSFFEYMAKYSKVFETHLIAKNNKQYLRVHKSGLPVCKITSLKFFIKLSQARFIICDGNPKIFAFSIMAYLANIKIVYIWHGTGFKNIRLGKDGELQSFDLKVRNKVAKLIVATSEQDKKRKIDSFQNPNVVITGNPKNDIFFQNENGISEYSQKYKFNQYDKIILYTPTFRDELVWEPFSKDLLTKLNELFCLKNYLFVIKKHAKDSNRINTRQLTNMIDISDEVMNTNQLLKDADMLISDYSGIISDFVLLNRPILHYIPDYDEYVSTNRSFYFNLKEIYPGPMIEDENALIEYLTDLSWFNTKEFKDRYKKFTNMFHTYTDGNSCKRVEQELINMISK